MLPQTPHVWNRKTTRNQYITMKRTIPQQDVFFYGGRWIWEMDTLLLAHLIRLNAFRGWNPTHLLYDLQREVKQVVNQLFVVELTNGDIASHVELLRGRYKTLKEVLATPGVRWDINRCKIVAEDKVWDRIFVKNPNAGAYYYQDEPQFKFMAKLFGWNDVKVEKPDEHEVITLSENTEFIVITDTVALPESKTRFQLLSQADPDGVTSPVAEPSNRVKRKLFVGPTYGLDRLSSNHEPSRCLSGGKEKPASSNRSSCASWTPTD